MPGVALSGALTLAMVVAFVPDAQATTPRDQVQGGQVGPASHLCYSSVPGSPQRVLRNNRYQIRIIASVASSCHEPAALSIGYSVPASGWWTWLSTSVIIAPGQTKTYYHPCSPRGRYNWGGAYEYNNHPGQWVFGSVQTLTC